MAWRLVASQQGVTRGADQRLGFAIRGETETGGVHTNSISRNRNSAHRYEDCAEDDLRMGTRKTNAAGGIRIAGTSVKNDTERTRQTNSATVNKQSIILPDLLSRKAAKAAGATRYFTGKPCQSGHVCERYTNTTHCVECDLIDRAEYRIKNRQKLREKNAKYRNSHKKIIVQRNRQYRINNHAKILERDRLYRQARRERKRQQHERKIVVQDLQRKKQATPIAAPDWNAVKYGMNTTLQRAEMYRSIYRAKKNSFPY